MDRHAPIHLGLRDAGNRTNIVFVTLCAKDRRAILAREDVHAVIRSAWEAAPAWCVGRYVIMPDHIHLFCGPSQSDCPRLVSWMSAWKAWSTRNWPRPQDKPVWQRSFWDRQLRSGDSYAEKWEYVRNNPVRHGLVGTPEDWRFQGEITTFRWHEV